jgi:UDP-2,3-diacylglucosamine pyrophosphatase LpxH
MNRWLAVISDLHISEGALDDFDAELESHLISFLEWLGARPEPAELVVNGDFLDFVQASPWTGDDLEASTAGGVPLCFTQDHSVQKLDAIRKAHPQIFGALKGFLSTNKSNRLVLLPGNHDPDFFWPQVREQFANAVCPASESNQLHVCLERCYRPRGYPWLWIEHGHQYDPVNAFFVGDEERWSSNCPPIFAASDGASRLYECTGTRFLIRYLNGLDARYPYVDNVKPFSRFIRIFGASALTPGWGPLDAAIAVSKMLAFLSKTAVSRPHDLLRIETPEGSHLSHPLISWIEQTSDAERVRLAATVRAHGFPLEMPIDVALDRPDEADKLVEFLAAHLDIVKDVGEVDPALLGDSAGTLTLMAGFNANETEDLYLGAERVVAREGVTTVVMGHTHEPIERMQKFTYYNTGSWTRYYRFDKTEPTAPWRLLREHSYEHFPYSLHYVSVPPSRYSARMETWRERFKT